MDNTGFESEVIYEFFKVRVKFFDFESFLNNFFGSNFRDFFNLALFFIHFSAIELINFFGRDFNFRVYIFKDKLFNNELAFNHLGEHFNFLIDIFFLEHFFFFGFVEDEEFIFIDF